MHLVGQALSVTKLNADNGDITFSTFIKDVVLICQRLLNTFSDKSLQVFYFCEKEIYGAFDMWAKLIRLLELNEFTLCYLRSAIADF